MLLRRLVPAVVAGVLIGLAPLSAAAAHVEASPATVAPDAFVTVTFTVPNEREDSPTVGLDLTVPAGFVLETAQQIPGWQTTVDKRADGTPTRVHWSGGQIPVGTFGQFAVRGRTPAGETTLSWPAVQHYPAVTVSWTGGPASAQPAPTLRVARGGGGAATPTVPLASVPATATGTDPVARSRAALALVLGGTGLLLAVGGLVVGWSRFRRTPGPGSPPAAAEEAAPVVPPRAGNRPGGKPGGRPPAKARPKSGSGRS